jgi:hypothetical protein
LTLSSSFALSLIPFTLLLIPSIAPTPDAVVYTQTREDQAAYGPEVVGKGEREFKVN